MFDIHFGRGEVVAVADIGSGSAGVAILDVRPDKPTSILVAERAVLPFEERTEEAMITGVAEQLAKAGEIVLKRYAALKKNAGPPRELYVIMRAPWNRSQTTHAKTTFKEEAIITEHTIGELAEKALSEAKDLDRKNLLEAKVIRVELNGYPCAEPKGKRAREISVYALASDTPSGIRSRVETALQKIFPHLTPTFRSSTWAAVTVLRNGIGKEKDYFVVDMSSEAVAFVAIRDGVAAEHLLLKEGVRTILKRVSGTGMPEETLTMMRMLSLDHCSDAACEAIQASLSRVEPELVRIFGEAVGTCASSRRLPNSLVLMVHPDMALWLSRFFSRIDFAQFTATTQPFLVRTLDVASLDGLVRPASGIVLDPGLALGGALVNIEKS